MEIFCFLEDYPKIGAFFISAFFGIFGWLGKDVYQTIIENKKYKKELKTFFWKEKINASKKASEFYLEYLNFLNLTQIQSENYELRKIEHNVFIENIQKEVEFYTKKLKEFPHFEHHHINIFYEFDGEKTLKIANENNQLIRELFELNPKINDNGISAKKIFKKLKENYKSLFEIQKGYVKKVREDIENYI
jgi:hypothetical protein